MRAGKYTKITVNDKGKIIAVESLIGADLRNALNNYGETIKVSNIINDTTIATTMGGATPTFRIENATGYGVDIDTSTTYGILFTPRLGGVREPTKQLYYDQPNSRWAFESDLYVNGAPAVVGDTVGRLKSGVTAAVAVTATIGSSTAFTITYTGTDFATAPAVTTMANIATNPTTNSVFAFLSAAPTVSSAACRAQRVTGTTTTGINFYWIATDA
jgi:hypothetical protein